MTVSITDAGVTVSITDAGVTVPITDAGVTVPITDAGVTVTIAVTAAAVASGNARCTSPGRARCTRVTTMRRGLSRVRGDRDSRGHGDHGPRDHWPGLMKCGGVPGPGGPGPAVPCDLQQSNGPLEQGHGHLQQS